MTKDEALELALQALEDYQEHIHRKKTQDAITAIKEALAQPERNPRLDQGPDYERGFVDGMLHQTQSSVDKAVNRMAQPAQKPVMQEKIHALKPMLEALRIKQVVSFSESQNLLVEVANKSGMLPPAFEISGNQWCALVNLAVARFGNNALLVQPSQEHMATKNNEGITLHLGWDDLPVGAKFYTTPPQRPWVELTKDQFLEAARLAENGNYLVAFNRIQQWLKEGNT